MILRYFLLLFLFALPGHNNYCLADKEQMLERLIANEQGPDRGSRELGSPGCKKGLGDKCKEDWECCIGKCTAEMCTRDFDGTARDDPDGPSSIFEDTHSDRGSRADCTKKDVGDGCEENWECCIGKCIAEMCTRDFDGTARNDPDGPSSIFEDPNKGRGKRADPPLLRRRSLAEE